MNFSKIIYIWLILTFFESFADVRYEFPESGTEIRFVCKETPAGSKGSSTQFTGSFTFKKLEKRPVGIEEDGLYMLTVKTSNGLNMSYVRAPWQIPFNIFSVYMMPKGQYKELLTSEKQRPSTTWKIGESRTISTIRTNFNDTNPVRFLIANDYAPVYTHNTVVQSKQKGRIKINGKEKQVETYHSISRVKNTKSGESYQWEIYYSPELNWATQTKRTQPDGAIVQCWSREWISPKKKSTPQKKEKENASSGKQG